MSKLKTRCEHCGGRKFICLETQYVYFLLDDESVMNPYDQTESALTGSFECEACGNIYTNENLNEIRRY